MLRTIKEEGESEANSFCSSAVASPRLPCALCRRCDDVQLLRCPRCSPSLTGLCWTCNLVLMTIASLRALYSCDGCALGWHCARHWIEGGSGGTRCSCGRSGVPRTVSDTFGRPRGGSDPFCGTLRAYSVARFFPITGAPSTRERAMRLRQVVPRRAVPNAFDFAWPLRSKAHPDQRHEVSCALLDAAQTKILCNAKRAAKKPSALARGED
jgi:hypothetical protein